MTAFLTAFTGSQFVIPKHVTLMFGPTARIRLGNGVFLVIEGVIEARPDRIFEFENPLAPDRGRVILSSDRIPQVPVEWWGTARSDARPEVPVAMDEPRRTQALLDCLDAVHRHRHLRGRRAALQVTLNSECPTDSPLIVGQAPNGMVRGAGTGADAMTRNHDGLLLRGSGPFSGSTILSSRPREQPTERLSAILTLDSVQGSRVEGVALKGGWLAEVGLRLLNPTPGTGRPAGTINTFRQVLFYTTRRSAIEVGPRGAPTPTAPGAPARWSTASSEDHSGTLFEQCVMSFDRPVFRTGNTPDEVRERENLRATFGDLGSVTLLDVVRVRASRTRPMTFRNCILGNSAMQGWRVEAGSVLLDACVTQLATGRSDYWQSGAERIVAGVEIPTPGSDVFMADPIPGTTESGAQPGRVTLLQVECQSRQMLDTFRGASRFVAGTFAPNVLVMNTHVNDANTSPWQHHAIWWEGPGLVSRPDAPPGALYLVHNLFGLHRITPDQGRVVVHEDVRAVYDLGSQLNEAGTANAMTMSVEEHLFATVSVARRAPQLANGSGLTWLRRPPDVFV